MTMVKSPLQSATKGLGGNYGSGNLFTEVSTLSAENCDPNVATGKSPTPVKYNVHKSPAKPKNGSCESELGKSPARRKLDCDGGVLDSSVIGRSPAKSPSVKEGATPPRKHFCRSPWCAANNPDYAVPVPRKFLKSKRHLLPGWQSPNNGKSPVSPLRRQKVCTSSSGHKGEHRQGSNAGTSEEPPEENMQNEEEWHRDQVDEETEDRVADLDNSRVSGQEDYSIQSFEQESKEEDAEEAADRCKDKRRDIQIDPPAASTSFSEDLDNGKEIKTVAIANMDMRINSEADRTTPSTSFCEYADKDALSRCGDLVEVMLDSSQLSVPAIQDGRRTDSDYSMRTSGGGDTLDIPREQPDVKGTFQRSRRQNFGEGKDAHSEESPSLKKQGPMKRKQAEDWMWDAAVKEAVSRLAPQGDAGVHVLVQAFQSVALVDEEIQASKYAYAPFRQQGINDVQNSHRCAVGDSDATTQVEKMTSIDKVHAWDETLASSALTNPQFTGRTEHAETDRTHEIRQAEAVTPPPGQDMDNMRSPSEISQQERFPPSTSNSEPSKLGSNRWAGATDASSNAKDEVCSEKGASSTSGKSGLSEWTCERKSQAGYRPKNRRKRYTSLQPFRLRTEERGAMKEHEFSKRLEQLWAAEQRLRIPVAQGLPWTTDEPEVPPKPFTKEQTIPEEFRLVTDLRAVERAEFDNYIAERNLHTELQRQEDERQRQIAEHEELKRLRREMVPRAQLMPYFDRPFMPRRSSKRLTVPKEPNFHNTQNKRAKCVASSQFNTA